MTIEWSPISRLMFRQGWLLLVAGTCLSAAPMISQLRLVRHADPVMASGYRKLLRAWLVLGNLLWVVMGVGLESGSVPSLVHYFGRPRLCATAAFHLSL